MARSKQIPGIFWLLLLLVLLGGTGVCTARGAAAADLYVPESTSTFAGRVDIPRLTPPLSNSLRNWALPASLLGDEADVLRPTQGYDQRPLFQEFSHSTRSLQEVSRRRRPNGPRFSYAPAPWLNTRLNYRRASLFESWPSRIVRKKAAGGFSSSRDRDLFDFIMSWQLARSSLDLGYRFESTRSDRGAVRDGTAPSWLPGSAAVLHGLTVGITRRWGGTP